MQIMGWYRCKQTTDNGIWSFLNTPIPLHRKTQLQALRSSSSYTNKGHKYPPLSQIPLFQMRSFHPQKHFIQPGPDKFTLALMTHVRGFLFR